MLDQTDDQETENEFNTWCATHMDEKQAWSQAEHIKKCGKHTDTEMKFNSKTSKIRGDVGGSSSSTPVSSIQSTNNKVQFRFVALSVRVGVVVVVVVVC